MRLVIRYLLAILTAGMITCGIHPAIWSAMLPDHAEFAAMQAAPYQLRPTDQRQAGKPSYCTSVIPLRRAPRSVGNLTRLGPDGSLVQDNHRANWGMSAPNRTAVLVPETESLTATTLLQALQARRVFATMDKQGQLVLTANGHLMGERFSNTGTLALAVYFRHGGGVGVVTPGPHFYYVRLTLADGKMVWPAPIWVDQQ